jgi:hypothetical protein
MMVALPLATNATLGQTAPGSAIIVTPDNFNRAETDLVFSRTVNDLGKFVHYREPPPLDFPVVRPNRDTLYSAAVFDLNAGPVTVTLPEAGNRFMSMQVIDEDQYTPAVYYGRGSHTLTKENVETRYVSVVVRTLFDPNNAQDVKTVHALQDAIIVEQPGGPGRFAVPNWDRTSQKKVRDALLALATTFSDTKRMFGARGDVDPVRHLIGTALGFGGNPEKDALYLTIYPPKNDGVTVYKLNIKDVPVEAFWSISVYDAEGHFAKNAFNAYSLNNITAKIGTDGSVAVQFGRCDGKIANCLPIMARWSYVVRLYRPRAEILNGTWKFPEAQPVQ